MALSPKQERFVAEYLVDLNATQAAIRAGYSPDSAEVQGSRLLRNAQVAEAVAAGQKKVADKAEVSATEVLRRLLELAESDIGEAFDENGQLLALHKMPPEVRRTIASVELVSIGSEDAPAFLRKVKLWDKVKGLELLGRHLKLFTDKLEVKVDGSFADLLKKARERAQRR